jgi:hypothetical protein
MMAFFVAGFLDEVENGPADDLLKGLPDEIRKAAVGGADFAIEAESEEDVIEGVDEIAIALLGTGDDVEELIHLLVADGAGIALLETADHAAQLGNVFGALEGVNAEERDENHEADGQSFEAAGERADGAPGNCGEDDCENKEEQEGDAPQLALALLELCEAVGDERAIWLSG